jgi:putative oxidoreductase
MVTLPNFILTPWGLLVRGLQALQPVAQLAARIYVGLVFFRSGLTKIQDWETTLLLFTEEYKVPLLPPNLAAYAGTAGELVLPVLLILGLGGRFAALGLFVVNLMAVLSLEDMAPAALQLHIFWGSVLVMLALWGPGGLALERWVPIASKN